MVPRIEIGYVVKATAKWEVDPESDTSEFDAGYSGKQLVKAWDEVPSHSAMSDLPPVRVKKGFLLSRSKLIRPGNVETVGYLGRT